MLRSSRLGREFRISFAVAPSKPELRYAAKKLLRRDDRASAVDDMYVLRSHSDLVIDFAVTVVQALAGRRGVVVPIS